MITVAVAAVVMAIALPSFTQLIRSNRVSSTANELIATVMLARTEAIRSPGGAAVCTSSDGASCDAAGDWSAGWIVFQDRDSDGLPTGADDTILKYVQPTDAVEIAAVAAGGGADNRLIRFDQRGRLMGLQRQMSVQAEDCSGKLLRSELMVRPTGQVALDRERKACL
jgi:type IV fimbrial biogenesis protein FimT